MSVGIMTSEKAYLFGLIVGGGSFKNGQMIIDLPYRLWGKARINPERAGKLATDILSRVRPLFERTYNMPVTFSIDPEWQIRSTDSISNELSADMREFGIVPNGKIVETGSITRLREHLNTDLYKRNFIAGLADSVGSLNPNHRRFDKNYQIISFELAAKNNFGLVFDVCQVLQEVNCYTDQLLWNHPNLHSSSNPYYESWRKGYKVRVLIDSYAAAGSFLFEAKAEAASENLETQNRKHSAVRCDQKGIDEHSVKTIHIDESSMWLPAEVRGLHFLHNKHICAVLGCPYAPVRSLEQFVRRAEYWINPFPIYLRDALMNVREKMLEHEVMSRRTYTHQDISVRELLRLYDEGQKLIWGNCHESGYPITQILQGIVWIIQRTKNDTKKTRIKGNYMKYLLKELGTNSKYIQDIVIERPDKLTPVLIHNNRYATIIGPNNPKVYRKLITRHDNLRISVRDIKEGDLD